jgi:hypothetical protein
MYIYDHEKENMIKRYEGGIDHFDRIEKQVTIKRKGS